MICPHCHHSFTPVRSTKVSSPSVLPSWPDLTDISTLSDADLHAYRKLTAPAYDIAFVLYCRPDLTAQLLTLPHTRTGARQAFDLARKPR